VLDVSKSTLKRDLEAARGTLRSVLGEATDEDSLRRIVAEYVRPT